jgi:hypothetical protein
MAKGHNCDKGAEFPRTPDSALRIVLPMPRTGHFDTTIKQMQIAVFPIATEEVEVIAALARLVAGGVRRPHQPVANRLHAGTAL